MYFIRFLAAWYSTQSVQIKWQNSLSESFGVRNGVRQGSVLSPRLFSIYLDGLLKSLCQSGFVAKIGKLYLGCLLYADDIVLISPTVDGLQKMIGVCSSYAKGHSLTFNSKKCSTIMFTNKTKSPPSVIEFSLGGDNLTCRQNITHLGVILDMHNSDVLAVEGIKRIFRCCQLVGCWYGWAVSK